MKRELLNRVASLGVLFWIVKIFSTTVGETAADYVSVNLNFGLTVNAIVMGVITIGVTFWNFRQKNIFHLPTGY